MQSNPNKHHLIVCGNKNEQIWAKIGKQIIWETKSWKLLGTIEELLEELLAKGKTITIYIHVKNL